MQNRSSTKPVTVDRRVHRTRHALLMAMMDLMVERGWDAIDVQGLCDRANIGRSTFYQHFSNKEELLKQSFAGLREELLAQVPPGAGDTPLEFVPALLDHVHEFQVVFRALIGRRSGQYVQERFRELLIELVRAGMPGAERSARDWQASARAHYLAGALFELLVWWLGSNRPHKSGEIAALFSGWSRAVLNA